MTDAPERLWARSTPALAGCGVWELRPISGSTEYIHHATVAAREERYDARIDALTEELRQAQAEIERLRGTRVKPLEWDEHPDGDEWYGNTLDGQCDLTGVNAYDVLPHPCATGLYVLEVMGLRTDEDYASADAAKEAAQAHHERRIASAIRTGGGHE